MNMDKEMKIRVKPYNVCLMGASLEGGNRGVSALAASLVKIFRKIKPNATITFLIGNRVSKIRDLEISGEKIQVKIINYRLSPKAKIHEHLFWILFMAFGQRIVPFRVIKEKIILSNQWLTALKEADFVGDIHGGDSFSDIYGLRRFIIGRIPDIIALLMKKNPVLLPQTYGPYSHKITRFIARYIMTRSPNIISRDQEGSKVVQKLLRDTNIGKKVIFCPDVAFTLDSVKMHKVDIDPPINLPLEVPLVGININGLMYNEGYTRDNMFGLKFDYKIFIHNLINRFMKETPVQLLLVPHAFGIPGNINSDPDACKDVMNALADTSKNRIHLLIQECDQSEIKGIISSCDFFVGSRMHACIAALSQGIPTMGVAYSQKFKGVFDSIGSGDTVLDARSLDEETIINKILDCFERRNEIKIDVKKKVAAAQERIMAVFKEIPES